MPISILDFHEVFEVFQYPAGEPHIKMKDPDMDLNNNQVEIITNCRDWNDLMLVVLANDLLTQHRMHNATFIIPYLPFSRHDRTMFDGDSRPVPFVKSLLGDVNVRIIDPHSEVCAEFCNYSQAEVFKHFINTTDILWNNPVIAIPDAGATKKAYSWCGDMSYVQCLKKRDPETGQLSGFNIVDEYDILWDRNVLIVDDICDGGGTFIGLAEKLKGWGCLDISLAVSHGLFTKGLEPLFEGGISKIYTLDNCELEHPNLIKVSLKELIRTGAAY